MASLLDMYGDEIDIGCVLHLSYGIPPTTALFDVVDLNGTPICVCRDDKTSPKIIDLVEMIRIVGDSVRIEEATDVG